MIKKIIKTLTIIFLLITLIVFYLSFFGVKTEKFNNQIINNITKVNNKIELKLNKVNFLLNPYNFTIKIRTKNPRIIVDGNELEIKSFKTNVSLKSLIYRKFLIDELEIVTEEIKINNVISLARSLKNSPQLFILNKIIKDGFISSNIKLNFDEIGRIKDDYQIVGSIKKTKFNIFNQYKLKNFNLDFKIQKDNYLLKQIDTEINNIKITSELINIIKDKNLFFVNGQVLNDTKKFSIKELKSFFPNLSENIEIKKIEFSTVNDFSFNINNKLKLNDLKIETALNLKELIFNGQHLKLKKYFPNFIEEIKLKKHKIIINYDKNKINLKGTGNILLENKQDSLSYQITKNNNDISFDTKINLKNNSLLLNSLDYEKKENISSLISIKGSVNKDYKLRFDFVSLSEKK